MSTDGKPANERLDGIQRRHAKWILKRDLVIPSRGRGWGPGHSGQKIKKGIAKSREVNPVWDRPTRGRQ